MSQQDTAKVLDILIQAGTSPLTEDAANDVKQAVSGMDVPDIDFTQPASSILATLRPVIVGQIEQFGSTMSEQAVNAVESLDPALAKETMMSLWGKLPWPVKFIILLLVFATVGATGYLTYTLSLQPGTDVMDLAIVALLPLFGLMVFCTWPIKTLAYTSLSLGSKVVEAKMQKKITTK